MIKKYLDFFSINIVKNTITTTALGGIGKAIGFLVPFFVASWYGLSPQTDAFFFAYGLIIFLATILSPVVESIIVPFIAESRAKGEDVSTFLGSVLGISAVSMIALTLVFLLIIKPVLGFATQFPQEGQSLIFTILIETAPLLLLLVWTSLLSGVLNSYKVFSIPALSPALRAVIVLGFMFGFKDKIGVHAIALGYVLGEFFRLVALTLIIKKLNLFSLRLSIRWDENISRFFKTSSYQIVGMTAAAFTPIINKTMASWLGPGNVTILEYSERLYMIAITLVTAGLYPVLLSHFSSEFYNSNKQMEKFIITIKRGIRVVFLVSFLVSLVFILLREPLVNIVYNRGKIPDQGLLTIQTTFFFFLVGFISYATGSVLTRALLTLKNTKVIMYAGVLNCILTVVFNYILMNLLGVAGIALATSITVTVLNILLFVYFFYNVEKFLKYN